MTKMHSVADLVALTGMSGAYWRKVIGRRELPVIRLGRSVRVLDSDIERFLATRVRPARELARIPGGVA
jgi:predicted DNA-binding transcriptional regulator AlpA